MKSWQADATFFDGDLIAGPFPTLFSTDSDASLTALKRDPKKCHWDLMKINRYLFMPENVSIEDAAMIVKKPR